MYFIRKTISNKIVGGQRKSYIILHVRQTSMGMSSMSQIRCFYRKTAKLKIMATYKCSIFLSQTTNEKAAFLLMII